MKQRNSIWPLLLAVGCGTEDAGRVCPTVDTAELECPVEVAEFAISDCEPVPDGPSVSTDIQASVASSTLHVELTGVIFRDNNDVCGYADLENDEVRVLLQPCVLVPEGGVSKGDCWYESVAFDVAGLDLTGANAVTVLQRVDRPPEFPPDTPKEIASAPLD